jgi:hypothetical protein
MKATEIAKKYENNRNSLKMKELLLKGIGK